ncbi:MAG: hypothetical protein OEM41_11050 [Ignavibacteria bacterium]|nr:hypothetical protein [Ignavibacteria bacterium]
MNLPRVNVVDVSRWVHSSTWFWTFVFTIVLAVVAYAVNGIVSEIQSGNAWGLTYGVIAAVLMVGAALYGARRRLMRYHLGRSSVWVQYHVYGGTLFMLMVFMHSGFHLPTGTLAWFLWTLSIWITISGLLGVLLQKTIPKVLSSGLSIEVVYERIPELVDQIRERATSLMESCTDPVRNFYEKNIHRRLLAPRIRPIYYIDITGGIQSRMRQFDYLRQFLSHDEQQSLDRLRALYRTKLELDAHYTLQRVLRVWLYLHVPVSLVLLILVGVHLYSVFYY